MQEVFWLQIGACLIALSLLMATIYLSIRARRRQRMIDNLPTSKTAGVFIGLVEVKGTAEAEQPITSYLAESRCVYYSYSVQEHWRRTVTETYTDSKGNSKTRTRTKSGWSTVASDIRLISFYLRDDTGLLLIHPSGAEIEASNIYLETCGRSDPLYYGKGPSHSVSNSTHRRRFVEHAINLHAPVYIIGRARERQDIVAPEIGADQRAPLFLISMRKEAAISRGYAFSFWSWLIVGLIISVLGAWGLTRLFTGADPFPVATAGMMTGGYLLCWLFTWAWMVYNSTIDLKNRVNRAWSLIDIELKRRSELIPQLVKVVQAFKGHETTLQTSLANLRSQAEATAPGQSGANPQACLPILMVISESYPQLKSNELFLDLQQQLIETEQRIALARAYFNDIATQHNTRIEIIPDRFFADMAGLKSRPLMEAADFERAAVKVKLSD